MIWGQFEDTSGLGFIKWAIGIGVLIEVFTKVQRQILNHWDLDAQ